MQSLELYYMRLLVYIFRTTAVPMNASRSLHGDGKDTNHKIGSSKLANKLFTDCLDTIPLNYYLFIDQSLREDGI